MMILPPPEKVKSLFHILDCTHIDASSFVRLGSNLVSLTLFCFMLEC